MSQKINVAKDNLQVKPAFSEPVNANSVRINSRIGIFHYRFTVANFDGKLRSSGLGLENNCVSVRLQLQSVIPVPRSWRARIRQFSFLLQLEAQ